MLNRHHRSPVGDEAGSIIIAMMVMMIISALAIAVTSRALVTNHAGRQDQDFGAGLPAADTGISDALLQLDNNTGVSTTGPCASQATPCFYNSGGVGPNTWSYVALQGTLASQWTIRSRGVANGREHDAVATIAATSPFDYGLFTTGSMDFSGNSCSANELGIPIATSGTVSSPCGKPTDCFLPSTNGLPACTPINQTHPEPLPGTAGAPAFPAAENCPAWLGDLGGIMTSPSAGTYYCNSAEAVHITGAFQPQGPVIIYVGGTATLAIDAGNYDVNWPGAAEGTPDPTKCTAVNLQIYSSVTSTFVFNGQAPQMCGGFYLPLATFTLPGDKWSLDGSVVASTISFKGKPHGQFIDSGLGSVTLGNWRMQGYHETGSTCTGLTC